MKKKKNHFYFFWRAVVMLPFKLIKGMRFKGSENVPEDGAYILASNHREAVDPIMLGCGLKRQVQFMAKAELSAVKFFGNLLRSLGVFFVKRGENDMGAIRTMMGLLKSGEKVGIFPEGTRVSEPDKVAAKDGAVRIAMRLGVPIIPAFISRKKRIFRKVDVVIGEP